GSLGRHQSGRRQGGGAQARQLPREVHVLEASCSRSTPILMRRGAPMPAAPRTDRPALAGRLTSRAQNRTLDEHDSYPSSSTLSSLGSRPGEARCETVSATRPPPTERSP